MEHYEQIKVTIAEKIEEVAEKNRQINLPSVIKTFDEFGSKFETVIQSKIDVMLQTVQNKNKERRDNTEEENGYSYGMEDTAIKIGPRGHLWSSRGKFWNVPNKTKVPKKVQRRRGWDLWLQDMNTPDDKKIYPFCEFTCATVPQAIYKKRR